MSLTSAGLTIKRLSDIVSDLNQGVTGQFGASTNTESDSVFGQLIGVFANELELVYELAQQLYDSFDPDQAEGASLDNICALLGLDRQAATSSSVSIILTGITGTLVPAASIVAVDDTDATQFQTTANVTLFSVPFSDLDQVSFSAAQDVNRGVGTWAGDNVFVGMKITFNGSPLNSGTYEVESFINPTTLQLVGAGIVGEINAPGLVTASAVQGSVDALAVDTGPLPAIAGTVTNIVTPVTGWTGVHNFEDATLGDANETDEELRNRRELSLNIVGAGVDWAIRSKLLELNDVDYVLVISNRSSLPLAVMPPPALPIPAHAFETIIYPDLAVQTYRDQIAQTIFYLQPAGIQAYGTTVFDVLDGQGVTQQVACTFATELDMYILAVVVTDSAPATLTPYPVDGDTQVAAAVLAEGQALGVGDDVLNWKFISSLDSIVGIIDVDVYIREGSAPPYPAVDPAYQANISVSVREIAKFDSSRVVVEST